MATHLVDLEFPPYVIKCVDETHFLVAGGGGKAKTGVPNCIEIFEVQRKGHRLYADSKVHYDTDVGEDRSAIMNAALRLDGKEYLLAAGRDEKCQFYKFVKTQEMVKEEKQETKPTQAPHNEKETGGTRKRKNKKDKKQSTESDKAKESTTGIKPEENISSNNSTQAVSVVTRFDLERLGSVQTDFGQGDKYQKAVCFSPNGLFFATGGADGRVRMWSYPSFEKQFEIEAHSKEVDDVIINPLGNRLVSVSRDATAIVWKTVDGSKVCDLKWNGVPADQATGYRVRCCRFGFTDSDPSKSNMYTIHVPRVQGKKKRSYLTRWNSIKFTPEKTACTGTEVLSALNVSHSGQLVGLGTMTGSVGVYVAFSLQKLRFVKDVHGIFVTGLCFVPMTRTTRQLLGDLETAVLSISADKKVSIMALESPLEFPAWLMCIGAFLLIVVLLSGLAALGLSF